jgi:hypothetical protein
VAAPSFRIRGGFLFRKPLVSLGLGFTQRT